jgi:hypothetical protein
LPIIQECGSEGTRGVTLGHVTGRQPFSLSVEAAFKSFYRGRKRFVGARFIGLCGGDASPTIAVRILCMGIVYLGCRTYPMGNAEAARWFAACHWQTSEFRREAKTARYPRASEFFVKRVEKPTDNKTSQCLTTTTDISGVGARTGARVSNFFNGEGAPVRLAMSPMSVLRNKYG